MSEFCPGLENSLESSSFAFKPTSIVTMSLSIEIILPTAILFFADKFLMSH